MFGNGGSKHCDVGQSKGAGAPSEARRLVTAFDSNGKFVVHSDQIFHTEPRNGNYAITQWTTTEAPSDT